MPIRDGRDLASDELWDLSLALSRSKRAVAIDPPLLPKARRASVSLIIAAVAAATPALASAHSRSGRSSAAAEVLGRSPLERGDRGPAVERLQRALGIVADGIFGRQTLKAVRAFQKRAGLTVDGIAGPRTLAVLDGREVAAAGGTALERGDRGTAVRRLQRALGISADGIFGRQTLKAVRAFQRRAGLTVDGIAGPRTLTALSAARALERGLAGRTLERGDRGPAVERLQRALGIVADGIFGPRTAEAVRSFQQRAGLEPDGIAGPATLAALANGAGGREADQPEEPAADTATPADIDGRLGAALALARELGLKLVSAHRPGAIIESSGQPSDHGVYPSRAIDVSGTPAEMERFARKVAGMKGVDTVIYSGVGIWTAGGGWGEIRTSVTYDTHLDHVHVDTF
ncbi:MAG: peptidoglycan-binding protein [Thermoleophilia bacterium]|nr:peptidoglycan-binding protein [Thermoleophilia bacterium]